VHVWVDGNELWGYLETPRPLAGAVARNVPLQYRVILGLAPPWPESKRRPKSQIGVVTVSFENMRRWPRGEQQPQATALRDIVGVLTIHNMGILGGLLPGTLVVQSARFVGKIENVLSTPTGFQYELSWGVRHAMWLNTVYPSANVLPLNIAWEEEMHSESLLDVGEQHMYNVLTLATQKQDSLLDDRNWLRGEWPMRFHLRALPNIAVLQRMLSRLHATLGAMKTLRDVITSVALEVIVPTRREWLRVHAYSRGELRHAPPVPDQSHETILDEAGHVHLGSARPIAEDVPRRGNDTIFPAPIPVTNVFNVVSAHQPPVRSALEWKRTAYIGDALAIGWSNARARRPRTAWETYRDARREEAQGEDHVMRSAVEIEAQMRLIALSFINNRDHPTPIGTFVHKIIEDSWEDTRILAQNVHLFWPYGGYITGDIPHARANDIGLSFVEDHADFIAIAGRNVDPQTQTAPVVLGSVIVAQDESMWGEEPPRVNVDVAAGRALMFWVTTGVRPTTLMFVAVGLGMPLDGVVYTLPFADTVAARADLYGTFISRLRFYCDLNTMYLASRENVLPFADAMELGTAALLPNLELWHAWLGPAWRRETRGTQTEPVTQFGTRAVGARVDAAQPLVDVRNIGWLRLERGTAMLGWLSELFVRQHLAESFIPAVMQVPLPRARAAAPLPLEEEEESESEIEEEEEPREIADFEDPAPEMLAPMVYLVDAVGFMDADERLIGRGQDGYFERMRRQDRAEARPAVEIELQKSIDVRIRRCAILVSEALAVRNYNRAEIQNILNGVAGAPRNAADGRLVNRAVPADARNAVRSLCIRAAERFVNVEFAAGRDWRDFPAGAEELWPSLSQRSFWLMQGLDMATRDLDVWLDKFVEKIEEAAGIVVCGWRE